MQLKLRIMQSMNDLELNQFVSNIDRTGMNSSQSFIPGIVRHLKLQLVRPGFSEVMSGCRGGEQGHKARY